MNDRMKMYENEWKWMLEYKLMDGYKWMKINKLINENE